MPTVSESASDSYDDASRMLWPSRTSPPRPPYAFGMKTESGSHAKMSRMMKPGKPRCSPIASMSPRRWNMRWSVSR